MRTRKDRGKEAAAKLDIRKDAEIIFTSTWSRLSHCLTGAVEANDD